MREIEFRGINKETGKWIYGALLRKPAPPQCIGNKKPDKYFIQFVSKNYMPDWNMPYAMEEAEIVPKTIGQYTGMKDINGTKIYEGDIVAEEGHYVNSDRLVYQKIQWKENYACWLRGEYQRLTPKNIERYKIIVIGNVIDNPELLEE